MKILNDKRNELIGLLDGVGEEYIKTDDSSNTKWMSKHPAIYEITRLAISLFTKANGEIDIANVFMFNNNNEKYQIQRHDFDIIGESTNIIRRKSDGVIINIIS